MNEGGGEGDRDGLRVRGAGSSLRCRRGRDDRHPAGSSCHKQHHRHGRHGRALRPPPVARVVLLRAGRTHCGCAGSRDPVQDEVHGDDEQSRVQVAGAVPLRRRHLDRRPSEPGRGRGCRLDARVPGPGPDQYRSGDRDRPDAVPGVLRVGRVLLHGWLRGNPLTAGHRRGRPASSRHRGGLRTGLERGHARQRRHRARCRQGRLRRRDPGPVLERRIHSGRLCRKKKKKKCKKRKKRRNASEATTAKKKKKCKRRKKK